MPVVDDGWGGDDGVWAVSDDGWGGDDGVWAVSAQDLRYDGSYDGWGCRLTSKEVILDIAQTMVYHVRENSRAKAQSVTTEMLRCEMRAHWSPLHQVVPLCQWIDDLRYGRVTPQQTHGRTNTYAACRCKWTKKKGAVLISCT